MYALGLGVYSGLIQSLAGSLNIHAAYRVMTFPVILMGKLNR